MHCGNCGKELAENEVCTCTANEPVVETPVIEEATPVVEEPAPVIEETPVVEETTPVEEPVAEPTYAVPPVFYPPVQNAQGGYYAPNFNQNQTPFYEPVPVNPAPSTDYPEGYKVKKKYIALILAVTLGAFGIHNFYLGHNEKAIAQLLLTTVGCLILVGPIITSVWVLIETVQILVDNISADANNFKLQTFAEELAQAHKNANK